MPTTNTLVIGAGQAGLAISRCLNDGGWNHLGLAAPQAPQAGLFENEK